MLQQLKGCSVLNYVCERETICEEPIIDGFLHLHQYPQSQAWISSVTTATEPADPKSVYTPTARGCNSTPD